MDPGQFDEERMPGGLLKIGQAEHAYWAFVPNSLPPRGLSVSFDLLSRLEAATFALGELAGLGRTMPNPHLFIRPFIRKEAVLSSMIEGTQTELDALMAVEAQQRVGRSDRDRLSQDTLEVLNYVEALEHGLAAIQDRPLDQTLICDLHEILLRGVRGQLNTPGDFRTVQNWIGLPGCDRSDAAYVPPPVEAMIDAVDDLESYIRDGNSYPRLIRMGLIHYQFEAIHPFADGNGRIGRLLLTLLTVHWGMLPLPLMYLSAYFERNRQEYYDRLMAVSQRGEWEEWLGFFLAAVASQADDACRRAKRLLDLQIEYREAAHSAGRSAALGQITDYLFENPVITISEVQHLLQVSYQSAMYSVDKLVKAGILRQVTWQTKPKLFVAERVLEIVG